jgi:hypothetical protein
MCFRVRPMDREKTMKKQTPRRRRYVVCRRRLVTLRSDRTYLVKYGAAAASDRTSSAGPGTRSKRQNTLRALPRLLLISMLVTVVVLRV